MIEEAELYHTELIEKICELDDDLMMQYLEGEEPSVDDLKAALRKGTCECKAVPVCCGTASVSYTHLFARRSSIVLSPLLREKVVIQRSANACLLSGLTSIGT